MFLALALLLYSICLFSGANALTGAHATFTWGSLSAGNCNLYDISLTVYNNGVAHWHSRVSSSEGSDSFGIKGLSLLDQHGVTLYTFGDFWRLTISHNEIQFNKFDLYFPAYWYPSISGTSGFTDYC